MIFIRTRGALSGPKLLCWVHLTKPGSSKKYRKKKTPPLDIASKGHYPRERRPFFSFPTSAFHLVNPPGVLVFENGELAMGRDDEIVVRVGVSGLSIFVHLRY